MFFFLGLGHADFSASNGWLDAFKRRKKISGAVLRGISSDVKEEVVADWSKRLPDICKGYKLEDIFNADETWLFYRTLPNRALVVKGDACKGGEKAKDRMTALVACSAMDEKLKLLVIGRLAKPRALQGYKLFRLGMAYISNKKDDK